MGLSKLKASLTSLRELAIETRTTLKEVTEIMRGVDPHMVRFRWIAPIWGGLSSLGTFALVGLMVQKVANGWIDSGKFTTSLLYTVVGIYLVYTFCGNLLKSYLRWRQSRMQDNLRTHLRDIITFKQMELDLGRLTDQDFIALKEATMEKGREAIDDLWMIQTQILANMISFFASITIILVLDVKLIVLALLPVIPLTIQSAVLDRKRRTMYEQEHLTRRKKDLYGNQITSRHNLIQTKLLGTREYMAERYRYYRDRILENSIILRWFDFKSRNLVMMIELVITGVACLYVGNQLVAGKLSLAKLFFVVGSMRTLGRVTSSLSGVTVELRSHCIDYRYFRQFLETKPLIDESQSKEYRVTETPTIRFENVTFCYPRELKRALDNCSFEIETGERVAIVGPNGCGKTTTARLMTKIYEPTQGYVFINQIPTNDIKQDCWLDHILCITQGVSIPDLPVDEAITGEPPELIDVGRMKYAAKLASADEIIIALPNGYQTQIGEEWPGGVGLSGGQRQRMKMAAAFYRLLKPNVFVGVFDEPMSHCDVETREKFYRALGEMKDKTIIVIAHDPMYLHHFERVIVMDKGQVVKDVRGRDDIERYKGTLTEKLSADL
jgi:ABC-type multidrug transport system fused ATPase/permease subunit